MAETSNCTLTSFNAPFPPFSIHVANGKYLTPNGSWATASTYNWKPQYYSVHKVLVEVRFDLINPTSSRMFYLLQVEGFNSVGCKFCSEDSNTPIGHCNTMSNYEKCQPSNRCKKCNPFLFKTVTVTRGHVQISSQIGFLVDFNLWRNYNLKIQLPNSSVLKRNMVGICGNNDKDKTNDLFCPFNSKPSPTEFKDCWATTFPVYVPPHIGIYADCPPSAPKLNGKDKSVTPLKVTAPISEATTNIERLAQDKCNMIINSTGPFQDCQDVPDKNDQYGSCVGDLMLMNCDEKGRCSYLSAFVQSCQSFHPGIKINWRTDQLCPPISCGNNAKYLNFAEACPATCENPNAPNFCNLAPQEGCQCNEGFILKNSECVIPSLCTGCIDHAGIQRTDGESWTSADCSQTCSCKVTQVVCSAAKVCDQHASCVSKVSGGVCTCNTGYLGNGYTCTTINACQGNECLNNATCSTTGEPANPYVCACTQGYTGSHCESKINFCASSPCGPQASACLSTVYGPVCTCLRGYTGDRCETSIDWCDLFPCGNLATCISNSTGFVCRCQPGCQGTTCNDQVNYCQNVQCLHGGTCANAPPGNKPCSTEAVCNCQPGYSGSRCEIRDFCASSPCLNGATCTNQLTSFTCRCPPGFYGPTCSARQNFCSSAPCLNNATCIDTVNGYTCSCSMGYTGQNCGNIINYCASNPCQHGATCNNAVSGFTCTCALGYTGRQCNTRINYCASNPCLNGATCNNGFGGYTCSCATGFTGQNCGTMIDHCANNPCLHGGTCRNLLSGFVCECATGYTGSQCETVIDHCASHPCQNGATCNNALSGFTCTCVLGYTGQLCSTRINYCASSPCLNGATCVNGLGKYTCSCPAGYTGQQCGAVINHCASHPCQNGATCTTAVSGFTCTCPHGYEGKLCNIQINFCQSQPCLNGATCSSSLGGYVCICTIGFTGTNCEMNVSTSAPPAPTTFNPTTFCQAQAGHVCTFGTNCSAQFYMCVGGHPMSMKCPNGDYYLSHGECQGGCSPYSYFPNCPH